MDSETIAQLAGKIIAAVEKRLPEYLAIEEDRSRNEGNSALCIVDEHGAVYEKCLGRTKSGGERSIESRGRRRAKCGSRELKPANTKNWYSPVRLTTKSSASS